MDLSPRMASAAETANVQGHGRSQTSSDQEHRLDRQPSGTRAGNSDSPGQRAAKKSASTCSTCRLRKVRCNGMRPVCSNCQRLNFPCAYEDSDVDVWSSALPRRRVRQACLSCHSRKARCSGHVPKCDRCRAQGIECVYQPGKRIRGSLGKGSGSRDENRIVRGSLSPDGDGHRHDDVDTPLTDLVNTPSSLHHDVQRGRRHSPGLEHGTFESLVGRTLDQFFRHVHHIPMYSFLHRASLMEQYNAGKVDEALLLALIGITSCLTDMGAGVGEYGDRCIDRAEKLIFSDYSRPSTFKVQALVFMIKHRVLSNRYPSAFLLLSIASRFAAALRLNHPSPNLCFLAQESRRRLMWSLYCIDTGISAGHRDFALWRPDRILVSLPCNERNFEFDLPQTSEMLDDDGTASNNSNSINDNSNGPSPDVVVEDVGSLALHIRVLHLRQKIVEFTKDALVVMGGASSSSSSSSPSDLQTPVLALHKQLDDFASRLPASFQFSESSLRLRAYSPRICVFVMMHVWWHQCHCDLYRMTMAGFREALPESTLQTLDPAFLAHCRRQCVDHSLAMAAIFALMQKLGARPVADLDLALCAYQCARMLKYASHDPRLGLTPDAASEKAKVCLAAIQQCCMGPAAATILSDLQRLMAAPSSSNPDPPPAVLRTFDVPPEPGVISTTRSASSSFIPPHQQWDDMIPSPNTGGDVAIHPPSHSSVDKIPEPNSAYEGDLDIFDQDTALTSTIDVDNPWSWNWTGDTQWPDFLSSGVGV